MALTSSQLSDLVSKTKQYLRVTDDDASLLSDAFTVYHDESDSGTAATVGVSGSTLTLIVTGGANAGTYTVDLSAAAYDTMTEVVDRINALDKGFVADLVGEADALSATLRPMNTVSCFGFGNMQTATHTDNSTIELIVQECFDAVENACGRQFFSATYDERIFTNGQRTLMLDQPDVQRVTFLGLDTYDAFRLSYSGSASTATVEVTDTMLRLVERTGNTDTDTTYTFSSSDFDTNGELVTTIDALSGWSATLLKDGPSKFLIRRPAMAVKTVLGTQDFTCEAWEQTDQDYDLDYEAGVVSLTCKAPYGIARVIYVAGLDTLPTPVEREVLRLTKASYEMLSMNTTLSRMKLGDYEIGMTSISVRNALDAFEVAQRLTRYMRFLP